jgi:hypothetical protein
MRIRTPHALFLAAAAAAGTAIVMPALAQDNLPATRIESSAKATPNKAGTPSNPQGVAITAQARLIVPPDLEAPIVTGLDIQVAKGLSWNGTKYTTCTRAVLERHGPSGCPRTSIIGTATATGLADTVHARVDVVFVNAPGGKKFAYASLNNPARIRETIDIVSPTPTGTWGHREALTIPRSLQIVGGVPLRLTAVTMRIGGKSYAKKYITSTSCPAGGWKYEVKAHYLYDGTGQTTDDVGTGSIPCTK